jgi:RNA polymerase sigma-70 factor, ECF subfamily
VTTGLTQTGTPQPEGKRPSHPAGDDVVLAKAVLAKNRKATAEFVDRYSDPLYGYLRNRLSPRTDLAEDILQDVFLTAWENLARYEGRSSLRNWLLGIARHKVETHYRSSLRAPMGLDDEGVEEPPSGDLLPDDALDREQMLGKAQAALAALPERYRIAILWRYWEGRSAAEMAAQIGNTEKAVERLLARARQAFRKEWGNE